MNNKSKYTWDQHITYHKMAGKFKQDCLFCVFESSQDVLLVDT
jgi:hypothetical protein